VTAKRVVALGLAFAGTVFAIVPSVVAQPAPECAAPKAYCEGADGYYAPSGDREKLASALEPVLLELRTCLESVGVRPAKPAVLLRFDAAGNVVESSVEAGGNESAPCVKRISARLGTFKSPHETKMRCEVGCPRPTPAPAPPPLPATTVMSDAGTPDAAPEAAAPPPTSPPPPAEVNEATRYQFSLKAQGGYERGVMYGVGVNSGRLRLGFGRQHDELGQYVLVEGRYGLTNGGLKNGDVRLGGELDLYRTGIVHLGLGGGGGVLLVERATGGSALLALTLGMHLHGGLDLVRWGPRKRSAITLDARLPIELYFTGYYIAAGLFLGVRQ
jgi:hypothetical protein